MLILSNRKNEYLLCLQGTESEPRRTVTKTKHPASAMSLGIIALTDHLSPPVWFLWGTGPHLQPNCNPLDYSIWWKVVMKACSRSCPDVKDMMAGVDEEWLSL